MGTVFSCKVDNINLNGCFTGCCQDENRKEPDFPDPTEGSNNPVFNIGSQHGGSNIGVLNHYDAPTQPISQRTVDDIWMSMKTMLQSEHKQLQIPKLPWLPDWELTFDDYYVELSMKSKNEKERKNMHLHDIFRSIDDKRYNRILIEAPAGYGKTTLALKLCWDHAKGEKYMQKFEAVIFLRLRGFEGTLRETVTNTIGLVDFDAEDVFEVIKQKQDKVLIVLDGFDELNKNSYNDVMPLLNRKQLPMVTVLVTSRRSNVTERKNAEICEINLVHCMDCRLLITGMTKENRMKFLKVYMKESPEAKLNSITELIENRFGLLFTTEEKNIFDSPLLLLLLVIVVEEPSKGLDIRSVKTKTDLYKALFNFMLRRMFSDPNLDFFDFEIDKPPHYVRMLCQFGSFALKMVSRKNKYSFTENDVLSNCENDGAILSLGILMQSDSKTGKVRRKWFEPVHLSFLEFATAYYFWVSLMRSSKLASVFNARNFITDTLENDSYDLSIPFLLGLSRKQLTELCCTLRHDAKLWVEKFAFFSEQKLLLDETLLTQAGLGKALVPLLPTKYNIPMRKREQTLLLREILIQALATRRLKRLIVNWNFCVVPPEDSTCVLPIKVVPVTSGTEIEVPEDWCEIATHQTLPINGIQETEECRMDFRQPSCTFDFTFCESTLDQQLKWLSKLIVVEGYLKHKPIHKIYFNCHAFKPAETLNQITELICQDRLESIEVCIRSDSCPIGVKQWEDFLYHAMKSSTLLEIEIRSYMEKALLLDLSTLEGSTLKQVKLAGNVIPCTGIPLSYCVKPFEGDLNNFISTLPLNVNVLSMQFPTPSNDRLKHYETFTFVQNDSSPIVRDIRDVFLTINSDTRRFLQIQSWEYLSKVQVLGIAFSRHFNEDCKDIVTLILDIIYNCPLLLRLELWDYCSEEFLTYFLAKFQSTSFEKEKPKILRSSLKQKPLQLDSLILSHRIAINDDVPGHPTVEMLKKLLLSHRLRQLWLPSSWQSGYTNPEFVKLFTPEEGFVCEVLGDTIEEPPWWRLEECHRPRYVIKISVETCL